MKWRQQIVAAPAAHVPDGQNPQAYAWLFAIAASRPIVCAFTTENQYVRIYVLINPETGLKGHSKMSFDDK